MRHYRSLTLFLCITLLITGLIGLTPPTLQAAGLWGPDNIDCTDGPTLATLDIPLAECEALQALYTSTDGPNWANAATNNWGTNSAVGTWVGVTVTDGNVTAIDLQSNNLKGTIPDLSALNNMTTLYLNDNMLTGPLPATLNATDMPNLTALLLRYNCKLTATTAQDAWIDPDLDPDWNVNSHTCSFSGGTPDPMPESNIPSVAQEEASDPEPSAPSFGDPVPCSAILFVDGWGIHAEGTPEQTAFTVPKAPSGYSYLMQPVYGGYCDIFTVSNEHSPLPVQVCWPAGGNAVVGLYHDQADLSRTWTILPTTYKESSVCASLPALGGVALLANDTLVGTPGVSPIGVSAPAESPTGEPATPAMISVMNRPLANPCVLTTTHRVHFRDAPGGAVVETSAGLASRIPYQTTLTATAESATDWNQSSWYQVAWLGQTGWISGDYVTAVCE
ncbi:hypothetical protein ACFLYO_07035 [Chloroflexota bacterium]